MNSQELRRSLKLKWLTYYGHNRQWIDKLGIWVNAGGQRRPSASFMLGTLATLEPDLSRLLPLVVDLSNSPDRIIAALGLNINPVEALKTLEQERELLPSSRQELLPSLGQAEMSLSPVTSTYDDEACSGVGDRENDRSRP